MTKVYKINELSDYSGEDNLTSVFLKVNEIIKVVNSLALSDKEEVKPCRGCELHALENMTGFIPNKCVGDCKPKQEKCEHDWIHLNKENVDIKYEYCKTCKATRIPELKQSTSLKESLGRQIQEISDWRLNRTGGLVEADKILKLLQSHLVKEVETLEPDKYMKMHDKRLDGYTFAKKDIIKIINNI